MAKKNKSESSETGVEVPESVEPEVVEPPKASKPKHAPGWYVQVDGAIVGDPRPYELAALRAASGYAKPGAVVTVVEVK